MGFIDMQSNLEKVLSDLQEEDKQQKRTKKESNIETLSSITDEKMRKLFSSEAEEAADQVGKDHILVVDDDIRVLKMVQEILKKDYNVSVAPSGKSALRFLEKHRTNLILLDYMMPEMSGEEVLEKLRANPLLEDIPVFFLTGVSDREKVKSCLRLRPKGYMLKPVKSEELLRRLKVILG